MSETRKVSVEMRPGEAFSSAVAALGGSILPGAKHPLYGGDEQGVGLSLPGWTYPIVLRDDGTLAYDDYHGEWGEVTDIERLGREYAFQVAEQVAQSLGYYSERVSDRLKVYFPGGAEVWIDSAGAIDCQGFNGVGCDAAAAAFAGALGRTVTVSHKTEYFQERARVLAEGEL